MPVVAQMELAAYPCDLGRERGSISLRIAAQIVGEFAPLTRSVSAVIDRAFYRSEPRLKLGGASRLWC
jgi:hypothetical protein